MFTKKLLLRRGARGFYRAGAVLASDWSVESPFSPPFPPALSRPHVDALALHTEQQVGARAGCPDKAEEREKRMFTCSAATLLVL